MPAIPNPHPHLYISYTKIFLDSFSINSAVPTLSKENDSD